MPTENENPSGLTDELPPLELDLLPWQFRAVFRTQHIRMLWLISGRGSGKSHIDPVLVRTWVDLPTDLYYGICAPTEPQLQTVLAPIEKLAHDLRIETCYAKNAPPEWRAWWDEVGIQYPAPRFRQEKVWIWETGLHIFAFSLVNNAWARAKSLDFNAILGQEITDPGVTEQAIDQLFGCLRCGRATRQPDGSHRCVVPGHIHQMVLSGNVPLNDPSHFIYKKYERYLNGEKKRAAAGKKPFFMHIGAYTWDNKFTGDDYVDGLRAAMDAATFEQQTSPRLERNVAATSYHQFAEQNILDSLTYDPTRALHIWFDWNATPAAVGWGHDLRMTEVPAAFHHPDTPYFGVNGELFSDNDPLVTEQVCQALLADPFKDSQCSDCNHPFSEHTLMPNGQLCIVCGWRLPGSKPVRHCRGVATTDPVSRASLTKYIRAPGLVDPDGNMIAPSSKPWRGLIAHRGPIYVYGDATGTATSSQAATNEPGGNIRILKDAFNEALGERVHFRFGQSREHPKSNPRVVLRLAAMNRSLGARNGTRSLFLAPWCTAHVDDMREVIPDPKTSEPLKVSPSQRKKGDYWKRTHTSDALGYFVSWRWPFLIPKAGGLPEMLDGTNYGPYSADDWTNPNE